MVGVEIGTVISRPNSPSPSVVDFVIHSGKLHRGMFVELDYSEGTLVCLVTDVFKTNQYFERFDSVKEFESSGSLLVEHFPVGDWEYFVATSKPLGVFNNGLLKRPSFPPSPGCKVRLADKDTLGVFLGFDFDSGLFLGEVDYHNVPVKLSLSRLLQKHLAVLAMSGAGKSYFVSVLLEEILSRPVESGRIGVVVFDVHGEYRSFADPVSNSNFVDFSSKTRYVDASHLRIGVSKVSPGMFSAIIPAMSSAQYRDLSRIIESLRSKMRSGFGPYSLNDLIAEILSDKEMKDNTKQALVGWLSSLEQLGVFDAIDNPNITELVKPGVLTIIDMSSLIDLRKKQILVAYLCKKLFDERRHKKVPPFSIVLEESHQFVPEKVSKDGAISRGIIETIAREGRKFGACLCLVSQRPINLSATILSQCNTNIILRITNPYDLDHIGRTSEGLDSRSLDMITSLRVGEALIVGEAVNFPVFFKVRKRRSQESSHEVSLEKAAKDFESSLTEKTKDIENYL
ncbi:MAG: ATP-binding protein [Candidatus Diapherotrites archaeon]